MRIEYICHACLLIDTGDLRIVTDPWFQGSAYCDQWHLFPKPVNTDAVKSADVVLLSHGHEDHTHEESLREINRKARVFYPYLWYGGIAPYLNDLGFPSVTEAVTGRTYRLNADTSITYIARSLDSIVVIEDKGKVFVNINDALHSVPPRIADLFVASIRSRWPRVDTLFCGFGGASYFPNTIHCPGKNDEEIGGLRERYFLNNLCRIIHGVQPSVAVPFAADFVLLDPRQRWINHVRVPRSAVASYYRETFSEGDSRVTIHDMYPGDLLIENELAPRSPYRSSFREGRLEHLIDEQYPTPVSGMRASGRLTETDAARLADEIRHNVTQRAALFSAQTLERLTFCLRVSDVAERGCFLVRFDGGRVQVTRAEQPSPDSLLVIDTSSVILRYSFASDWGGDALVIGYGCEIEVFEARTIEEKLDTICVQLLTRHPRATRHMKSHPFRAAEFFRVNPLMRSLALQQLMGRGSGLADTTYDQVWLTRSRCEICQVCDLPMLGDGLVPVTVSQPLPEGGR